MSIEIKEDYIRFLDNLESWGVQNLGSDTVMPYLRQQFPFLTVNEAVEVISYWQKTKNQLLNENAD